ncbi:acyclic terpene utilization AtuA family protein [Leifsonia shinshuensis]|uniref:acyclic terpene utilization AtuA family protein n=1 Tax=Leifsonia shinshuensis TaxID=150026 RepID=UPI0028645336|nr:acyclic terpene utilization AtuA family protein [Leifsonia shinshuensis]MDR6972877.1 hypothetical protein [Leifsonia shinshuensis]
MIEKSTSTFRMGVGAGFAGDRLQPAEELARDGALDAMAFECLAERTIGVAQQARREGTGTGFDSRILRRLAGTLPFLLPSRAVVTTNAGAADPVAAAAATRDLLDELGLDGVVAAVVGDDVLDTLDLKSARILGTDDTLWDIRDRVISANAYIGAEPLMSALAHGADVVVAGRCSDAALFVAPIAHHFGWSLDDLDAVANASLVGHLLECAGQLTGGYFSDTRRKQVMDAWNIGFPVAEVSSDGSAVYSKLPGTGGMIDRRTVLEQLFYEIDEPSAYKTPDVTMDFSAVTIDELADDLVHVAGVRPAGRPETLKVSVGVRDGFLAVAEIAYSGADCVERGELAASIVCERWERVYGLDPVDLSVSFVGLDATRPWWTGARAHPSEVRLRMSVRTFDRVRAVLLCDEVESLYTNGPFGGGGVTTSIKETIGIVSTLIDRQAVATRVLLS